MKMWTMDRNLGSDRPSHGQIRTLDQDYHLKVDEWTDFLPWTVHLMDEFGQWTKKIILRWTIGRIFDSMDGFGRWTINISTRWMELDEWTGRRMEQTDRWTDDPLTIFLYSINGWGLGKFEIRIEGNRALQIGYHKIVTNNSFALLSHYLYFVPCGSFEASNTKTKFFHETSTKLWLLTRPVACSKPCFFIPIRGA